MMSLKECLKKNLAYLRTDSSIESPERESRLIIASILDISFEKTFTHDTQIIEEKHLELIHHKTQLRKKGHSIAHIVGKKEFYGRPFQLLDSVLMPRPETEHIIDCCLEYIDAHPAEWMNSDTTSSNTILDLCTGTGCIPITIALECKKRGIPITAIATDIDKTAIENVSANNKLYDFCLTRICKGDLFHALEPDHSSKFSIITANPPYVPSREAVTASIPSESLSAIDGGQDGLQYYRRIIPLLPQYLKKPGFVAMEIGYNQAEAVTALMHDQGFKDISMCTDLVGLPRTVYASY